MSNLIHLLTHFLSFDSHQGYFGKKGIRVFHAQGNWKWAPVVNTDKLWSLVDEKVRLDASKSKAKTVPVIDVTKLVSRLVFSIQFIFAITITTINFDLKHKLIRNFFRDT